MPLWSCRSCDKFVWNYAWKRHQFLIVLSRDLNYLDVFELFFPLDKFQVFFNLQHGNTRLIQTLAICGQHAAMVCFICLWIYGRSNKLETSQILLSLFCLKKDQFWFLLMLRTCAAEVCQNILCAEMQIAKPPRQSQEYQQLWGKFSLWISMYFRWKIGSKLG